MRLAARALLREAVAVDDVLQETALECWRKFESFDDGGDDEAADDFARWATVILRFKVREHFRDSGRDRLRFADETADHILATLAARRDEAPRRERALAACLKTLSAIDRRLVLAVHRRDDSVRRLAEETGRPARRLYRRVDTLRLRLLDCINTRLLSEDPA